MLWDTHAHLTDEAFQEDLLPVLTRARQAGVTDILVVGYTADSSERAVELAAAHQLHAAVGLHPNYLQGVTERDWRRVEELLRHEHVVAVGETGLDGFRKTVPGEVQREWFRRHLELAYRWGLPVVIHSRDAGQDVVGCLREASSSGLQPLLILHSFSESAPVLHEALALGAYISFSGNITYRNRKFDPLRQLARQVPAEKLLVETDAPYLAPEPHRGARNEPSFLRYVVEELARLRGVSFEELATSVSQNARRIFQRRAGPP
jgi:TatD DNase family protein